MISLYIEIKLIIATRYNDKHIKQAATQDSIVQ